MFEHFMLIKPRLRALDMLSIDGLGDMCDDVIRYYLDHGINVTCFNDDDVIAMGGVMILRPGVGMSWALTTDRVEQFPLYIHKMMCSIYDIARNTWNLHRIEAAVRADHAVSLNWHRRVGFSEEGTARAFYPDQTDAVRFAKLWIGGGAHGD